MFASRFRIFKLKISSRLCFLFSVSWTGRLNERTLPRKHRITSYRELVVGQTLDEHSFRTIEEFPPSPEAGCVDVLGAVVPVVEPSFLLLVRCFPLQRLVSWRETVVVVWSSLYSFPASKTNACVPLRLLRTADNFIKLSTSVSNLSHSLPWPLTLSYSTSRYHMWLLLLILASRSP